MKKFWFAVSVLMLGLSPAALAARQVNFSGDGIENAEVTPEAERNRELLEIWKDHVKTLTKERDDAYRQLEAMKTSRPGVSRFGGVETQPIPGGNPAQIQSLQAEIGRLQTQLEKRNQMQAAGSNREIQMQFSAMQTQMQNLRKELSETREEKDRLIQEKEKALSQLERAQSVPKAESPAAVSKPDANLQRTLSEYKARVSELESKLSQTQKDSSDSNAMQAELESLRSENERLRSQKGSFAPGSQDTEALSREKENFMRQARQLQYENDTLRAQIEKLQVVEKELMNTRAYFTPLVDELNTKNSALTAENQSLRKESENARAEIERAERQAETARTEAREQGEEAERLSAQIEELKQQNQQMEADIQDFRNQHEEAGAQIAGYKSQMQRMEADLMKSRENEQALRQTAADYEELQRNSSKLQQNIEGLQARVQDLSTQLAASQKDNQEARSREREAAATAEKLRTGLQANLTDMKNLKTNFEAYLESLVASFDERQR